MDAKVDIRKLQLLNDRINQTIDALNQVRLSVHGLAHTGVNPMWGIGNPMTGGYLPGATQGFGQIGAFPFGAGIQGLSHSSGVNPLQSVFGQVNPLQSVFGQVNPMTQALGGIGAYGSIPGYGSVPAYGSPLTNLFATGLQHSSAMPTGIGHLGITGLDPIEQRLVEVRASDPTRVAQTFPFALTPGVIGGYGW
jgi:hypothetical protein